MRKSRRRASSLRLKKSTKTRRARRRRRRRLSRRRKSPMKNSTRLSPSGLATPTISPLRSIAPSTKA